MRGSPNPRLAGVNVHVETQDPPSLRRSRRKSVEMTQVVTRSLAQLANRLYLWAKRGAIGLPTSSIPGQHILQPRLCVPREVGHHLGEPSRLACGVTNRP